MWIILVLATVVAPGLSYPSFQEQLPNGNNINHPCKVNYRWPGLGHQNPLGGGAANQFGVDFKRLGGNWNQELCLLDSDQDGRTNGEELGDPSCTWQPGQAPPTTENLGHPGVCEPVNSPQCMGKVDFVDCEIKTFEDCESAKGPNVLTKDLIYPRVKVPNTETNYFCLTFDLPQDQDYHMVAYEPLIDNLEVMHHIILYGCKDASAPLATEPQLCGMAQADNNCDEIIGLWAVGVPGVCFPENLGFRFGQSDYPRVKLEAHYNNPTLRDDWTDASGMRMYYQPAQPQFQDLYTLQIGQMMLEIPPGQARVEQTAVCPGSCSQYILLKEAYIHSAFNHMHYLGRAMKIELFRNGSFVKDITNEAYYSYDNPIEHMQTPHTKLLPGDEIRTKCVFNSLSTSRYTYWGEGTNDEMCFGFLTIYPKDAVPPEGTCLSFGPASVCDLYAGTPVAGCDFRTFLDGSNPESKPWWEAVQKNCNVNGFCRPECKKTAEQVLSHPCMAGEMKATVEYMLKQSHEGTDLLARVHSCSGQRSSETQCPRGGDSDGYTDVRDHGVSATAGVVVTVTAVISSMLLTRC